MILLCDATHTHQGIPHTSKSCIDTHTCNFSNLLKAEVLIETHIYHLALTIWKGINKTTYVAESLFVDHLSFNIIVTQVDIVEQIDLGLIIGDGILVAFLTKSVDNHVMSNTGEPRTKLTRSGVTPLLDSGDSLDKGLLEDILCYLLTTYYKIDVIEKFTLITSKQLIKRLIITLRITCNQHIVGKHIQVFHYYLLCYC